MGSFFCKKSMTDFEKSVYADLLGYIRTGSFFASSSRPLSRTKQLTNFNSLVFMPSLFYDFLMEQGLGELEAIEIGSRCLEKARQLFERS